MGEGGDSWAFYLSALYQFWYQLAGGNGLNQGKIRAFWDKVVPPEGFEPPTP